MVEIKNKKLCESCFAEVEEGRCPHCGFSGEEFDQDPMVLPMGTMLQGNIRIGRVMGKGGFGITYLGYDLRMDKTIAVKEYYPNGIAYRSPSGTEVLVNDPEARETFDKGTEKFYAEAEMVAQFNGNPNIVGVYDYFRANNTVYLIMEYLHGITLKKYVKKHGKLTDGQALFVMDKMAAALSITHSADVLHRDISPDNIMVCLDGKVKLIDFGAARQIVAEGSSNLTVVMKPGYTPIEQYTKKGKQGAWTDIHALGASIYYALTKKVIDDPYERMENDTEFESNIHGIDDTLWNVIKKCTMINGADRYGNAIELRKAISGVSGYVKPEPITIAEDDVKISTEEQTGDVRVSLSKASTSSVKLLASMDAEGIENYSQPAVPESEGYDPEVNVYEIDEDNSKDNKKTTNKRLIIGVTIIIGVVILGILGILATILMRDGTPTDPNTRPTQRLVIDHNDELWAVSKSISKEVLEGFRSDIHVTLNISTNSDPGIHEYYKHCIRLLDSGNYDPDGMAVSVDNGVFNSTLGYDVYAGQETFEFVITKETVGSLDTSIGFSGTNVYIKSAVLEAMPDAESERTIVFDEGYPGDWKRYNTYISKKDLMDFDGNVRVEVEYQLNTLNGYIKPIEEDWNAVAVKAPNILPEDGEAAFRLGLYTTSGTFVFIITKLQIDALTDRGLYLQVSELSVQSVTLKSWPYGNGTGGGGDDTDKTASPVVLTDFPQEYEEWYGGSIPMYELLKFGGDVRATFDITTGYFCELPEDNGSSEPGIFLNLLNLTGSGEVDGIAAEDLYGISNPYDDPGIFAIPYGTTEFAAVIPRSEIEKLNGDLIMSVHDLVINSVTLEDAETAAANDEAPGTRTAPTVMDYPDEYVEDWYTAATLLKKDLAAYGHGVKVTLEIESGQNKKSEAAPCMKITYGDRINADNLIDGGDLKVFQGIDDVIYSCPEGKTVFVFYVSEENIKELPETGLSVQVANVMIRKATITPLLTFELDSADPGDWIYGRSIYKGDFTPYYPGDIKVTLQLERTKSYSQHDDWLDTDIYFYHLCVHDGRNRSVITSMFNLALATDSDRDGNFFLGGTIEEDAPESRTDIFEFVMTKEEVERIDTLLWFKCGNSFIRSATFEAYDPAEDAISADAKVLELGLSWKSEGDTGTTDITKNDLESIGGDVLITLDITGELLDPNGDGIAHIYPLDSRDGTQVPLYARNQGAAEDHAYNSKYDFSSSYCLGYWEYLPDQVQFVITEEQIKNLGEWGIHFSISNGHVTKAYLEPA